MKGKAFHRSSLWLALGLALAAPIPVAFAANTDGTLVGHVEAGAEVTVRNPETGFVRTVTADADGNYRFPFLPVGTYTVEATKGGQSLGGAKTVYISLGNATSVDLGAGTLETVEVIGANAISPIDTTSTESATNITFEELQRLPVERDALSVAMLAPGVVRGEFGGVSFGGSSVAENAVYINGLNVTDFYNRVGFSSVPFAFFQEFQVKTGGYSVEFGRTTGGVINAVTKSGTNDFTYGAELVWEPDWLQSEQEDHEGRISRYDEYDQASLNLYAGGPIVKDKLFFYAMYEGRDNRPRYTDDENVNYFDGDSGTGFWGAKLDWQLNPDNVFELLAFSDNDDIDTDVYDVDGDTGNRTYSNTVFEEYGGTNWSLSYTGYLTDAFTMRAMYGENDRNANVNSLNDQNCSLVQDRREGSAFLGCTTNTAIVARTDERKQMRLDFEWDLGDHLLRFGVDHEENTSNYNSRYPGPGYRYEVFDVADSGIVNGTPVPPGTEAYVRTREVRNQGTFETSNEAYYLEDNWQINDYVLINAGLRWEAFDNKDAAGNSYIKIDDMIAPRLGFSIDPNADGAMKIYGNIGRYFLPVANVINIKQAGPFLDRRTFYVFEGFGPDNTPILGDQIGPIDDEQGDGTVPDIRGEVDADMDPVYQDELILGFQQQLSPTWSWGVRGIYRQLTNAIDDMHITWNGLCETDFFAMANPGEKLTVFTDTDCDGENDNWMTIDTHNTGWASYDEDDNIIGIHGWHKPHREYRALEFQLDRAWDNKWSFNASYTLAFNEGNAEGPVNSDTDFADAGRTEAFDTPWVNFYGYGWLPNDRRHQVKAHGTYAFNDNWQVGASLDARSGRPVSAFGAASPFDVEEFYSLYVCVANCDAPNSERVYQFNQRGSRGRLPWTYDVGANVTYMKDFGWGNLRVKFAVFNLFDQQKVTEVNDFLELEDQIGDPNEFYLQGTDYQQARYGQFTVSLDF